MKVCIVAPGHSVEKHPDGSWASTGLFQEITFPEGSEPPFERTGHHNPLLSGDSPTAYLGGGWPVVRAVMECFELARAEAFDVDIILPAGRPGYLQKAAADDPTVTEASVIEAEIRRELGPDVTIIPKDRGLTTKDDVLVILEAAANPNYERVIVVMMGFRIARTEVLLQETLHALPKYAGAVDKVAFMPAEALVPQPREYFLMTLSDAYWRTMANERFGIMKAITTGNAATTGGKT